MLRPALPLPRWPSALPATALLLALALPFEAIPPVVRTPWLALSDLKLVIALAVLAYLASGLPDRQELRAALPTLVLLAVAALSASLSAFPDDGLRATGRLALGAFGLLLGLRLARPSLLWAIVLGAGASALLGLGEAAGWPGLAPLLATFKVAPTRVGGELRVSASFQYATIAAMYFEMATPLALVLAAGASSRALRWLALGAALACTAATVLSLTRAGMLTLAVVFSVLLALAWHQPAWRGLLRPTLLAGGLLVGLVSLEVVRDPVFDLRLVSENDADWYGAIYSVPPHLELARDRPASVGLDVRNAGRIVWSSHTSPHPFALGYRWLSADDASLLDLPPGHVSLPRDVAPGESIHLEVPIGAASLPPGSYRLAWGMAQQDVVQFDERGWPNAETVVQVDGAPGEPPLPPPGLVPRDDAEAPWVVPRAYLWQAAVHLIQRQPLLGVGPDNFRHLYGAELGLDSWDERIQANNLYLELLVDLGIVGLAAFGWLLLPAVRRGLGLLRPAPTSASAAAASMAAAEALWRLGPCLAVLAFLVHGLLDTFLSFVPTALLFWLCLGLVLAQKPHVSGR